MTNLTINPSKHPLYNIWANMRKRCLCDWHPRYGQYGGRGIKICSRWGDFWTFVSDMPPRPGPEFSIDRIDVNGDYTPENCKWSTMTEQAKNRQDSVATVIEGQRVLVKDVAPLFGLAPPTVGNRIRRGWTVEAALYFPNNTITRWLPVQARRSWDSCFPNGAGDGYLRDAA